jgi:hypothetical protein
MESADPGRPTPAHQPGDESGIAIPGLMTVMAAKKFHLLVGQMSTIKQETLLTAAPRGYALAASTLIFLGRLVQGSQLYPRKERIWTK